MSLDLPPSNAPATLKITVEKRLRAIEETIVRVGEQIHIPLSDGQYAVLCPIKGVSLYLNVSTDHRSMSALITWMLLPLQLYLIGKIPIHASSIRTAAGGFCFAGAPRTGKSTLAAFFLSAGYEVLSEDTSYVSLTDQGIEVHPGGSRLRLREKSSEFFATQDMLHGDWQHCYEDRTVPADHPEELRFENKSHFQTSCSSAPLSILYVLQSGKFWSMNCVQESEAAGLLIQHIRWNEILLRLYPENLLSLAAQIVEKVQVGILQRSEDFTDLPLVENFVN